jgi:acyl dehydratase
MMADKSVYFEDLVPGEKVRIGPYHVDKEEVIDFSLKWNPLPFHIDEEAAKKSIYGGITAPSAYILAVRTMLLDQLNMLEAMLGTMGWDEVRFHKPARAGDDLSVDVEWMEKRVSNSKPDRGVVKMKVAIVNQRGEVVLSHFDTIMLRLRKPGVAPG